MSWHWAPNSFIEIENLRRFHNFTNDSFRAITKRILCHLKRVCVVVRINWRWKWLNQHKIHVVWSSRYEMKDYRLLCTVEMLRTRHTWICWFSVIHIETVCVVYVPRLWHGLCTHFQCGMRVLNFYFHFHFDWFSFIRCCERVFFSFFFIQHILHSERLLSVCLKFIIVIDSVPKKHIRLRIRLHGKKWSNQFDQQSAWTNLIQTICVRRRQRKLTEITCLNSHIFWKEREREQKRNQQKCWWAEKTQRQRNLNP